MQTFVRLPMQSSVRHDLCQTGLKSSSMIYPSPAFYLWKETMSHPPSLFSLNTSSGSESPKSTLHLNNMEVFPWLSATLLNYYKGTQMTDMDEDLAGMKK
jgi:hypothetical protein